MHQTSRQTVVAPSTALALAADGLNNNATKPPPALAAVASKAAAPIQERSEVVPYCATSASTSKRICGVYQCSKYE